MKTTEYYFDLDELLVLFDRAADRIGAALDEHLLVGGITDRLHQRVVELLGDRTRYSRRTDKAEAACRQGTQGQCRTVLVI